MGMIWPKVIAFSLPFICDGGILRSSIIPHKPYANQKISIITPNVFETMSADNRKYIRLIVLNDD